AMTPAQSAAREKSAFSSRITKTSPSNALAFAKNLSGSSNSSAASCARGIEASTRVIRTSQPESFAKSGRYRFAADLHQLPDERMNNQADDRASHGRQVLNKPVSDVLHRRQIRFLGGDSLLQLIDTFERFVFLGRRSFLRDLRFQLFKHLAQLDHL